MVITIGRQYGSGGREVGQKLADMLGMEYYDNELLTIAAKKSGFDETVVSEFDEMPNNSLIYNLYMNSLSGDMLPLNQKLAFAQFDAIRDLAAKGSCVIVGRCADYVLRERKDVINVFIHAPMAFKEKRIVESYGVPAEFAVKTALKRDKKRASYYSFYTHNKWGDVNNYQISMDSSLLGIDDTASALAALARLRMEHFRRV